MPVCSLAPWGAWLSRLTALAGFVLLFVSPAAGQERLGVIVGVVRDSVGLEVSAAEVVLQGTSQRMLSDERGAFRFARVASGEATIGIRRLGFRPATATVTVAAGAEVRVNVQLIPVPTQLPVVEVRSRAQSFDSRLEGFHTRREKGVGSFVTRERLERVHSYRFTDILRELPGVRIRSVRGGGSNIQMRGANCFPLVFIDGFPAAAGTVDLDMIDLATVEGIEVYHGLATIPPEFVSVRGGERCGVVAIWSRPYRPPPRAPRPSTPVDLEQLVADRAVFTAEDVDSPAVLSEGTFLPAYPDSLWRMGVSGRVVAEFIVDAAGRVQAGSFRVVSATHLEFAAAVRRALDEARFAAAVWQGRHVRQLVQLPFVFEAPKASGDESQW